VFTDATPAGQVLTGVAVRAGSWLDSIQGLATPLNLSPHGGTGGGLTTVSWPSGEYLVRIYGTTSGTIVGSISFVTNTGRIYGPYGTTAGTAFDYTVPAGTRVRGFTGASSGYLNAIGVAYGP
jgi:large repetitive protein